jgi:hypothetical protein
MVGFVVCVILHNSNHVVIGCVDPCRMTIGLFIMTLFISINNRHFDQVG